MIIIYEYSKKYYIYIYLYSEDNIWKINLCN